MKSLKVILQFLAVLIFAITIIDCDKNSITPEQPKIRGEIISTNSLKVYSTNEIKQLLTAYNIPFATELTYSVEVIQMVYQTVDSKENYIQASGAVMIPVAGKNLPLLSLHHGTETKRELVASVSPFNSTEGIVGLMIAATGYFCCIPDYPGFGVSEVLHPLYSRGIVVDRMQSTISGLQNRIVPKKQFRSMDSYFSPAILKAGMLPWRFKKRSSRIMHLNLMLQQSLQWKVLMIWQGLSNP